jgi:hypothetical protein
LYAKGILLRYHTFIVRDVHSMRLPCAGVRNRVVAETLGTKLEHKTRRHRVLLLRPSPAYIRSYKHCGHRLAANGCPRYPNSGTFDRLVRLVGVHLDIPRLKARISARHCVFACVLQAKLDRQY